MRKTIATVMVILVIVMASIPLVSGMLMERTVRNAFQDINAIYADIGTGYSLEIINYNRRYLTSDIVWKMDLGALKTLYHIDEVVFKDHAKHGFDGVVSTTSLEKNPWFATFVDETLQGRNPVHITTKYGFLGDIETTVALDAFSFDVDEEKIDVKPGKTVLVTDHKLKHFNTSGNWQGLTMGETLSIGKASMASKLEMLSTYTWDGDISFAIQNLNVQEKEKQFEIKGLTGKYFLNANDDRSALSGEVRVSIDALKSKNVTVDDASVRFTAKGLNASGYEEFMKMYTQTVSAFLDTMASFEMDSEKSEEIINQQMASIGFQMVAAYEKLLKQGLEFQISDLHVNLPDGDITGDITMRLLKDMTFMQFVPLVAQPELLLDIFYLKSYFSIPVSIAGGNPKMLAPTYPGMQTGLFVKRGANLVHRAETIDGRLVVNNEEVVLRR